MLWIKAFHIIFVIMWFVGLLYLPRLFVYHAMTQDAISNTRFKIMEKKLYALTTFAGIFAIIFGIWLVSFNYHGYMQALWLQLKLGLVLLLVIYHVFLGKCLRDFKYDRNRYGHVFYRVINEVPAVVLVGVVLLVVIKPFL